MLGVYASAPENSALVWSCEKGCLETFLQRTLRYQDLAPMLVIHGHL